MRRSAPALLVLLALLAAGCQTGFDEGKENAKPLKVEKASAEDTSDNAGQDGGSVTQDDASASTGDTVTPTDEGTAFESGSPEGVPTQEGFHQMNHALKARVEHPRHTEATP